MNHTDKVKTTNESVSSSVEGDVVLTQPEKCCENGLKKADAGTVPCFKDHTQPESSWESKFTEKFYIYNLETKSPAGAEKEAIAFIKNLIEVAEERGYKLCEKDTKDDHKVKYGLGLERGRREALEELEGKLPPEESISEAARWQYAEIGDLPEVEGKIIGFNRCRTTVLNIIKSIKGE